MNVKKIFIVAFILLCFNGFSSHAQEWSSPEIEQMYQQGVASLSRGNASEAVAIFQKVLPLEPGNILVKKTLAQAYQVSGNYQNALLVLEPMFASGTADAECYRIAAQCYEGIKEDKKAQKIIAEGIDKYPQSGLLYYQQGLFFKAQKNYESALKSWLDGIAADPDFHLNYHEAAIAYVQTDKVIWAIIYGEIFVNKEPNTQRGNETRILLLDAYQKLFFTPSKNVTGETLLRTEPANFEEAVKKTYLSLFFVVSDGITTENLMMLRSRFMVSWLNTYAAKYPFSLYAFHHDMMADGYFDVYNQWLFGKAENPQQYSTWMTSFADDMGTFEKWRMKKPLRMQTSDNYNADRNFKGLFGEKLNKAKR
jgi:outer membrane protein assembly factor BamD (BamD/ComL family)